MELDLNGHAQHESCEIYIYWSKVLRNAIHQGYISFKITSIIIRIIWKQLFFPWKNQMKISIKILFVQNYHNKRQFTDILDNMLYKRSLRQAIFTLESSVCSYQLMKNILLPGGIGYIGSHVLLELLLNTDHQLTVIDNYFNCSFVNLERVFQSLQVDLPETASLQNYRKRVQFYSGDILDKSFLYTIFQRCQQEGRPITSIIHFAALKSAPDSLRIPFEYYENNVVGSMNLIKMMQLFSTCKQFIFSSSAAVYGEQDNCTEDFFCAPISPYGQSKLCVDWLLRAMARSRPDWKVISLRYFNPAGNHHAGMMGDNPIGATPANLFSIIQQFIIGKRSEITVFGNDYNTPDGTGVRDFVHVVDLAKGHLRALQYIGSMKTNYNVFNLGSMNGFSVLEVIKTFEELLGEQIKYSFGKRRSGDLQRLVTASEKAESVLGWKAEKNLRDMCESCIKFTVTLKKMLRNGTL